MHNKASTSLRAAFVTVALLASAAGGAAREPVGAFSFTFIDTGPTRTKEIEVAAAAGSRCATRPCNLIVAMHGVGRNADASRNAWLKLAEQHDLIVVAPRFDAARFPARLYQRGGVTDEADRTKWVYNTVERLYDHLVATGRATKNGYVLYGHSAGAQFGHRMAAFMPNGRMRQIIIANAGYYTLPTSSTEAGGFSYPYSLQGTPASVADRKALFARRLHVLLGDQDNDPVHHQLNNSRAAKAQGAHRLARGQFFFATAKAEAARLGTPFNWKMTIVPGVAHENRKMTKAAGELLFGSRP